MFQVIQFTLYKSSFFMPYYILYYIFVNFFNFQKNIVKLNYFTIFFRIFSFN